MLDALYDILVRKTHSRMSQHKQFYRFDQKIWPASRTYTQFWRQSFCWMSALGARWPHWVNEEAEADLSRKMCEAHVCWLSVRGCLPPAVCLRLSAVQWIVVASFQCQCLQLLMVLPVIQCCLQCSKFLGRKTESTKRVTTITITKFLHYILYILIKLRTK